MPRKKQSTEATVKEIRRRTRRKFSRERPLLQRVTAASRADREDGNVSFFKDTSRHPDTRIRIRRGLGNTGPPPLYSRCPRGSRYPPH